MSNKEIECRDLKTSVKIEYHKQGSGIIFLPTELSPFAYILTAKHNFFDLGNPISLDEIKKENILIEYKRYKSSNPIKVKCHDIFLSTSDLILIVLKNEDIDTSLLSQLPVYSILNTNKFSHCVFKGYPDSGNGYTKCLEATFHDEIEENVFSIKCGPLASFDESEIDNTKGFSGSGLITGFNNKPTLIGVIIKVANVFDEIECIDLSKEYLAINLWLSKKNYIEIDIIESESIELSKSNEIETVESYQTNLTTDSSISTQHKEIIKKLESYDIEGAKNLLRDITEPSGETYRLHALVALTDKNISLAFSHIENAKNKEVIPNDLEFVKGLVYYFSAIDEKGYKKITPYAIDRLYIKKDQISQENILKAQEIFFELSDKNENTDYDVWYLASLHLADLVKTEEIARELIEKNPLNYGAITYATAFGFDIDLNVSIQKLEKIKDKSMNNIIDLVNCYNHHKLFDKTIILLEENENSFDTSETLEKCYVNTYMLDKKFDDALKVISRSKNETIKKLENIIIIERYFNNAQWDDLISYYEKDSKNDNLYNICKIKAIQNDWEFIANKANVLLEKLPLFKVLDLVVTAKYNTKQYKDVLELLESGDEIYFTLNEKFKRIKSNCLFKLGNPLESSKLLDSLENKTSDDIFTLIDISRKTGDSLKVESLVSDFYIKNKNNLNTREQLQLGNLVKDDSPDFANKIYEDALSKGLNEKQKAGLLLEALEMSDRKLFDEIISSPYVVSMDLGEEFKKAIEIDQNNIYQNYLNGNISFHKLDNQNYLIESFNYDNKNVFFSRAGNRAEFVNIDSKFKNIYCDISSLFFIYNLDLFENIFDSFDTVYIPMNTIEYINNSALKKTTLKKLLNYYINNEGKILFTDELLEDTSVYQLEKSLEYIYKTDIKENSVVLFDDRAINKYAKTDKANIFGINDLLYTLFKNESISEDIYYKKLLLLREKNLMFIPFSVDELIYYLQKATIKNDKLIETLELGIIRKHFAYSMQNIKYISIVEQDEMSETHFFVNINKLIENIYHELWNIDKTKWEVYFEYLHENFYILNLGYLIKDKAPNLNENSLVAINLSSLVYISFFMIEKNHNEYINKIEKLVLEPIFYSNKVLFNEFISTLTIQLLQDYEYDEKDQRILNSLQADFIKKLPFKVRNALIEDERISTKFDFIYPMKLWDKTVDFDELLVKIENVLNHGKKEYIDDMEIYIEENQLLVKNIKTSDIRDFSDDFYILSNDKLLRRKLIDKNKEWIDCKRIRKKEIIKNIQVIKDPIKRFKKFEKYKRLSPEHYYKSLFNDSKKTNTIDFNNVIPEDISLVSNYFRFELIYNFDKNKKISIKELLCDRDLSKILHKIFALPQELHSQIYKKVAILSHEKQVKLLKEYHNTVATPLNIFHLINLINNTARNKKLAKRVIRRILNKFSKNALINIKAYLAVYKYMFYRFKSEFDIEENLLYVLSWGHTDRIFRNFLALGIDLKQLEDIFTQKIKFDSSEIFSYEKRINILHPNVIDDVSFLFKGLNYALKDDIEDIDLSDFKEFSLMNTSNYYKLFKDFSLLDNKCDSFMNKDYMNFFSYIDKDEDGIFSNSFLIKLTNDTITDLKKAPYKVELYNILIAIFDKSEIYKENKKDLLELMQNIDFESIEDKYYIGVLNFISIQNIYIKDEILHENIEKEIIEKCRGLSSEKELGPYFDILVYLSIDLCAKIEDRVLYFTNLLRDIETDENRNFLKLAIKNIMMQLPLSESNILSEYLVEIRTKC